MQKIKIKTTHIKTPEAELRLEYYLLLEGGMCGIEVRETCDGESAARFVPDTPEAVYRFLLKLARHALCPVHLGDVVDDYVYEKWSMQNRFELLYTGADARLDRGERQREKLGDLRAGVAANER